MALTVRGAIAGTGVGRVLHGAKSFVARPKGFAMVIWLGSVEPKNAIDNDLWVDTS